MSQTKTQLIDGLNINTSVPADSLVIDSSGNVGIGTTSPQRKLVVSEGGAQGFEFFPGDGGGGNTLNHYNRSTLAFINITTNADQHIWGRSDGEKARLDSSGRLLVGTSTSATGSAAAQYARLQVNGNTGGNPGTIVIGSALNTASVVSGSGLGYVVFADKQAGEYAWIGGECDGTPGTNDYPGRLVFSTTADGAASATERMRILNNGLHRMLSSSAPTLEVRNTLSGSGDPLFQVAAGVSDMNVGGSVVMRVMGDGDVENATGVYTNPVSDERFKTDIVDVGSQWNDIKNVKLKKFRYKNNPDGELQLGIIAQELEPICPNLIKRKIAGPEEVAASNGAVQEGEEYLSWKASLLPLKAVKALQEAMERIETLEAEVAALKAS